MPSVTSGIDAAHELLRHVLSCLLHIRKSAACLHLSLSPLFSLYGDRELEREGLLKILARKGQDERGRGPGRREEEEEVGWCKSTKVSRAWDHSCQCWVPARVPLFPFCSQSLSTEDTGLYIPLLPASSSPLSSISSSWKGKRLGEEDQLAGQLAKSFRERERDEKGQWRGIPTSHFQYYPHTAPTTFPPLSPFHFLSRFLAIFKIFLSPFSLSLPYFLSHEAMQSILGVQTHLYSFGLGWPIWAHNTIRKDWCVVGVIVPSNINCACGPLCPVITGSIDTPSYIGLQIDLLFSLENWLQWPHPHIFYFTRLYKKKREFFVFHKHNDFA